MRFYELSEEDQQKGIPSDLIAGWINKDIEIVNILMPLMEFKRFTFSGCKYWVNIQNYDAFQKNIEELLLH